MSYKVEQKIGNNVYVYEVESYWDPIKKQPRQRRRYIGKKDPVTGKIITPRKGFTPRNARDFGHIYLLISLGKRIGLYDVLKEVYPEEYKELFNLSMYQVLEGNALYLYKSWAEGSFVDEESVMSSQSISRLMESIGKRDGLMEEFFRLWIKRHKPIRTTIFDITSLSSYSKLIEYLEWGYNRDGESLPQVNFGVVVGYPSFVPISYRIYPGSIADVVTLKNLVVFLKGLGVKDFLFILDRGFYSAKNIRELKEDGIGFVIPLSWVTKIARQLVSRYQRELLSPVNGFYYRKGAMFHVRREVEISGVRVYAHIYHDERRKAEELESFMRRIVDLERNVAEGEFKDRDGVKEYIEQNFRGGSRIFEMRGEAPHFRLERRVKVISRLINRMGKTILITDRDELGREEVLEFYRRRDVIEKMFDVIKNELSSKRLRVSSRAVVEGRIFLTFLSLILYFEVHRVMKEEGLYKSYTISEVFNELKKLKVVTLKNGKGYLTEVTRRQRTLFEKFKIPIPIGT